MINLHKDLYKHIKKYIRHPLAKAIKESIKYEIKTYSNTFIKSFLIITQKDKSTISYQFTYKQFDDCNKYSSKKKDTHCVESGYWNTQWKLNWCFNKRHIKTLDNYDKLVKLEMDENQYKYIKDIDYSNEKNVTIITLIPKKHYRDFYLPL